MGGEYRRLIDSELEGDFLESVPGELHEEFCQMDGMRGKDPAAVLC